MVGIRIIWCLRLSLPVLGLISFTSAADPATDVPFTQEELRQQQPREALETRLQPQPPDIPLRPARRKTAIHFPLESPCFPIATVDLVGGNHRIERLVETLRRQATGKCLGTRGIHLLMTRMQNLLVDAGLITTRVLAPSQELTGGVLRLVIVMGKVGDIRIAEASN